MDKASFVRAAATGEFGGITMAVDGHRWNDRVFAYGAGLRGKWLMTKRYQELLKEAWELKKELGASAIVYTQLTDVEDEINGLYTYDRAVLKPDAAIVAAATMAASEFTLPADVPASISVEVKNDEDAEIYLNGVLAAEVRGLHNQHYFLQAVNPAAMSALKPGANTMAVHCHQTIGGQIIDVGLTEDNK